jgi:acyl-CoA thioesterase I
MRWIRVLLLCGVFAGPLGAWAGEEVPACEMPADDVTPAFPLQAVGAALAKGAPIEILALGSGSTVGDGGHSNGPAFRSQTPGGSFPYRMLEALRTLRPGQEFHLTVEGGKKLTAEAMLPVLHKALESGHYDLVLWQTGTVEAVRGLRPEALANALSEGIEAAAASHADIVLIDPQFSHFLRANADLTPYQSVMSLAADNPSVNLFHRFDLTQTWANDGQIDVERVDPEQRDKTIATLNTCLGYALARFVLTGATEK